jgi:GT2 family glycosyltransferase
VKTSAYIVVTTRGQLSERVGRSLAAARSSGYFTAIVENGREPLAAPSRADFTMRVENRGYGHAVNAGIREVRRINPQLSNVVFSNDDIEVPEEAFDELERRVTHHPECVYSLASTYPDGTSYFGGGAIDLKVPHLEHHAPAVRKGVISSGAINGAIVACAPKLWDEVGGFDEQFFLYFEDLDLSIRLAERHVSMLVLAGFPVIHEHGRSGSESGRYYYIRSQILFARKWLRRDQAMLVVARALVRGALGSFTWRSDLRRIRHARFRAAWDAITQAERPRRRGDAEA